MGYTIYPFHLHTSLDNDVFTVTQLQGKETLATPYCYELDCISESVSVTELSQLLGQAAKIKLAHRDGSSSFLHGMIDDITVAPAETKQHLVHLRLVPKYALLKHERDWRMFQNCSVIDIFKQICHAHAIVNIEFSQLEKIYPKKEYCTQCDETTFEFLQRILSEAGIFYYFTHQQHSHTMILLDNTQRLPYYQNQLIFQQWQTTVIRSNQQHSLKWQTHFIDALSDDLLLRAGMQFHRSSSLDENDFWVHAVEFNYNSETQSSSHVHCVSSQYPYQTPLIKKPRLQGHYSAEVWGPKGQTIHTDADARVRVRFLWQDPEQSSCWLPVAQTSSRHHFIPRIGDEVQVAFINGDPDQPIVTGCHYHQQHRPPYKNKALSGIKGDSATADANEIVFDDTPQKECLTLSMQDNGHIDIAHQFSEHINYNKRVEIGQNYQLKLEEGSALLEAAEIHLFVGQNGIVIKSNTISLHGRLELLSNGVGSSKAVARLGDTQLCPAFNGDSPHVGGKIDSAASNVYNSGRGIACQGDALQCQNDKAVINQGIASIRINGRAIACVGHQTSHGGYITQGSPNIKVSEKTR